MLLDLLLGLGMVVGPVLAFLPQYLQIQSSGSSEGFSPLICFILLTANILKVFFWLQKRFEITLLLQSVFMIIAQLALLDLLVRYCRLFKLFVEFACKEDRRSRLGLTIDFSEALLCRTFGTGTTLENTFHS